MNGNVRRLQAGSYQKSWEDLQGGRLAIQVVTVKGPFWGFSEDRGDVKGAEYLSPISYTMTSATSARYPVCTVADASTTTRWRRLGGLYNHGLVGGARSVQRSSWLTVRIHISLGWI